ncbi:uncharacterized protein E0L32_004985 [Thyridium curvatum]|uniref:EKC/KEOPS complex subunit BUD32 n=1 Tax=Thyridium curvatum TaxID=1093900 RepID=A0A507B6X3_9PEZI|nr:uncharacterized protein E0L32_004985 [Thyridium curvatum]TPX14876.1 hypothetical protein E0L32_004985 [Thyridium curvatum]
MFTAVQRTPCDVEQQDDPKVPKVSIRLSYQSRWVSTSSRRPNNTSVPDSVQNPPQATRVVQYVPIPGKWARKLHPHWAESAFELPTVIPEGHIYYITKGFYVRQGATALVERLPSGDIVKTPLPNPYDPKEELTNIEKMEHEYEVYRFIGANPFIPKLIHWDSQSKTLVLENHSNGDLETYLRHHDHVDINTRRKWALQAAQALESLHTRGVIHQDVTPRNFLLDKNLDLRICDFAGSSFPGHLSLTGAPGPRYQSQLWTRDYIPTQADDIFGLGSVLYFIMCNEEPYSNLDEDEIESRFRNRNFPVSDHLDCGAVIQSCWEGRFTTAGVVRALVHSREINHT